MSAGRIMAIDDDLDFLALLQTLLIEEGYEVILATTVASAYPRILAEQPDVLILDIRMHHPRAGWVLLDLLRAHPRLRDLPVLVCTGDQRFLEEKAQRLRAKGCLTLAKPFELTALVDLVARAIDRVQVR